MPKFGETPVGLSLETDEDIAKRLGLEKPGELPKDREIQGEAAVATETPQAIAEEAEAQMAEDHATADALAAKIINGEVGTVAPGAEGGEHDAHVGAFRMHEENEARNEENSRLAEASRVSGERFAEQVKNINEQAEKFVSRLSEFKLSKENLSSIRDGKISDIFSIFDNQGSFNRLYDLCKSFVDSVPGEMQATFATAKSKMEVASDSSDADRLKGESIAKTFEGLTSIASRINQATLDRIPKDVIKAAQLFGNMQIADGATSPEQEASLQKRNRERAQAVQEIMQGLK